MSQTLQKKISEQCASDIASMQDSLTCLLNDCGSKVSTIHDTIPSMIQSCSSSIIGNTWEASNRLARAVYEHIEQNNNSSSQNFTVLQTLIKEFLETASEPEDQHCNRGRSELQVNSGHTEGSGHRM